MCEYLYEGPAANFGLKTQQLNTPNIAAGYAAINCEVKIEMLSTTNMAVGMIDEIFGYVDVIFHCNVNSLRIS